MFLTTRRGGASLIILLCAGVAYCSLEIEDRRSRHNVTDVVENATDIEDYPEAVTIPEKLPTATEGPVKNYEEHLDEHDTVYSESKHMFEYLNSNKSLDFVPPGYCGDCLQDEISYCTSNVIQDHCCCDKKDSEVFTWLPYTCHFGPQPCALYAKDCETYEMTRDCCCNKILKDKWLKTYHLSNSEDPKKVPIVLIIFLLFLIGVILISRCITYLNNKAKKRSSFQGLENRPWRNYI